MILRIKDWDKHFENAASRKLKRLEWVAIPNKTDGEGYTALVDHPHAAAHLGAWYAIIEAASKQDPRGQLPSGIPHGFGGICRSLGRMSRLPASIFEEVIPRLIEIGWLEDTQQNQQVGSKMAESPNVVAESAREVADSPDVVALQGRELQGITKTSFAAGAAGVLPFPGAVPQFGDLVLSAAKRMAALHPQVRTCSANQVRDSLRKILDKLPKGERPAKLEWIERNHSDWCRTPQWKKDGGEFAKGLEGWLAPTKGRYDVPAPSSRWQRPVASAPTPEQEREALEWMANSDPDPQAREVARRKLQWPTNCRR